MKHLRIPLIPLFLLGIVAILATMHVAGASSSTAKSKCKLSGIRYTGTTSQKKQLCFTLSADRKKVREYDYGFRDSCGNSGDAFGHSIKVRASGSFSDAPFAGSSSTIQIFKGLIRAGKASGTLREAVTEGCDTGLVRWTAHRVR